MRCAPAASSRPAWPLFPNQLVLFRRRARDELSGAKQRSGRAFEKAVRRKPLARRTRGLMQIEWSEAEGLKVAGVGTEG
jgi:hypothetical protein